MAIEDEHDELLEQSEMRPPDTGLYCFLNGDRACNAECMAYVSNPNARSSSSELNQQQQHCAIVSGAERTGRGLIMIASGISGLLKKQAINKADKARQGQFPANTSPFGKDGK